MSEFETTEISAFQIEDAIEHFEGEIVRRPEVMECYLMTGEADYLLRVVVPDLRAYERFAQRGRPMTPGGIARYIGVTETFAARGDTAPVARVVGA